MDSGSSSALTGILAALPKKLSCVLDEYSFGRSVEEIRLRVGRTPQIVTSDGEMMLEGPPVTGNDAKDILERLCKHSIYAHSEELKQGFLSFPGGVRVGICGRPITDDGRIVRFTDVSSFNIRLSHEVKGCAEGVINNFLEHGRPVSSLIVSAPGGGKTTLLRDIARCISNGVCSFPLKVGIADERGEIAGCIEGVPSFDVGCRTDVMELVPKADAIRMLVRTMSPEVIVTDEIGGPGDSFAVAEAGRCGVTVIAAAHASSSEDVHSRRDLAESIGTGVFTRILLLRRHGKMLHIFPVKA